MSRQLARIALGAALIAALTACGSNLDTSRSDAEKHAQARTPYTTKNDVEFNNYNTRQQIADDPTTILWCTTQFPVSGTQPVTFPIVGKLTSGTKRPYPAASGGDPIGPDGMYGTSGDYRYGFTPTGAYVDFSGMPVICTTEPLVWQQNQTTIVLASSDAILTAQREAQSELQQAEAAKAANDPQGEQAHRQRAEDILAAALGGK